MIRIILINLVVIFLSSCIFAPGEDSRSDDRVEPFAKGVPVFPGAEGFGTRTPAGRGGKIIKVTNLNDTGAGSLREAVQTRGARTVVFEVSGVIQTHSTIVATDPYLTIAGQTAPPPGITLQGHGVQVSTHDVLVQHLFIRVTDRDEDDGARIHHGSESHIFNVIFDHVSLTWGNDENASITKNSGHDFTFSNCLIGEGHYGLMVDEGNTGVSFLKNLVMSAKQRHPRIKGKVSGIVANNVLYNCSNRSFAQVGSPGGANFLSIAGNVFIPGPNTKSQSYGVHVYSIDSQSQLYVPHLGAHRNLAVNAVYSKDTVPYLVSSPPAGASLADIRLLDPAEVERHIIAYAGARPAERPTMYGDAVDKRLLSELRERRGAVIDRQKPSWSPPAGNGRHFQVPEDPHGDADGDGYTNIEEVLHGMAAAVEGR